MFEPLEISIGAAERQPRLVVEVLGYQHPDTVEPADLDLMHCRMSAQADPVNAAFDMPIGLWELFELRDYLAEINTGNGPPESFLLAGGLLTLSFAPSKRGPVLCAVLLKTIDASHVRLEYLITLEPQDIARTHFQLSQLKVHAQK
ncbi:MAG TPA: hypothetical protein VFN37_04705 [Candidatus Baltobacteraceae bacterium]|nr:hypothetical protein [Candidatus Baltobacteraceae bacterium]